MNRILWLDDDAYRTKHIKPSFIGKGAFTWVKTAEECIEQLKADKVWDWVFLDHDLGGEIFVESGREDCGMEVVRWIVEKQPIISHIIIHTANSVAGKTMLERLREIEYDVKYIPIFQLQEYLNSNL